MLEPQDREGPIVQPFLNRARRFVLVGGVAAAVVVTPSDVPAPGRVASEPILAHAPAPPAPAHLSEPPRAVPAPSPVSPVAHHARTPRATKPDTNSPAGGTNLPAAPGAAGRIIALDPETGQFGAPSEEQLRALRAAPGVAEVSRSEEGLIETRRTDGTVLLNLNGRFQENLVARIDRNGRLIYDCIHDDGKPVKAPRDTAETSLEEK